MARRCDDALGFVRMLLYSVEAINSSDSILIGRCGLQLLEQLSAACASTLSEKINSFRGEKCRLFGGAFCMLRLFDGSCSLHEGLTKNIYLKIVKK